MAGFSMPIVPRYAEVDQQRVAFNAHCLTWFDEAFTAFRDEAGASYPDLMGAGLGVTAAYPNLLSPWTWGPDPARNRVAITQNTEPAARM